MPDPLPVSNDVYAFMQASSQSEMRGALGPALLQTSAWLYDSGGGGLPGDGKFRATAAGAATAPFETNTLKFGSTIQGQDPSLWGYIGPESFIVMSNGVTCEVFRVTGPGTGGDALQVEIYQASAGNSWNGTYCIFVIPYVELEYLYASAGITPVADGTYITSIGGSQNGTITTKDGIIIGVQEPV